MNNEMDYVTQDWITEQFQNLRFRISFDAKSKHRLGELEVINDMDWVKRQIEDASGGIRIRRDKLKQANLLWDKYSAAGITEDNIWKVIDHCIDSKRKINAIKEYRKFFQCGLREAKEAIDTREMNNKGMV